MFCDQCGTQSKPGAKFCHACGHSLEAVQEPSVAVPGHIEHVQPPPKGDAGLHPWRRFFARTIDLLLAVPFLIALYILIARLFPNKAEQILAAFSHPILGAVILYWLWVPMEAAFLTMTGTTPAKWIFGIRVLKFDGRKLTFAGALRRAAFACGLGDGLGIPGAGLFTRAYAYDRLKKTETTAWDMASGSVVQHSTWGAGRLVGATVAVLVALMVSSVLLAIGRVQEANFAKNAFERTPATADLRPRPAGESLIAEKSSYEVEAAEERAKREAAYNACLEIKHLTARKKCLAPIKKAEAHELAVEEFWLSQKR